LSMDKCVTEDFPVVCVGGSAGGLDAYTRLIKNHAQRASYCDWPRRFRKVVGFVIPIYLAATG